MLLTISLKKQIPSNMRFYFKLHCCLFLLVMACGLFSQRTFGTEPYQPRERPVLEEPWRWHRIPELDGKDIRCMAEDKARNMWFGLGSGQVLRFDGLNWTTTDPVPENAGGPPIRDLCCGEDGVVYSLTQGRIDVWDGEWKSVWKNESGVWLGPTKLACLPGGRLLVQCDRGLLVIEGERMEQRTLFTSRRFIQDHGDRFRGKLNLMVLPLRETADEVPQIKQLAMNPQGGIAIAMMPNLIAFLPAAGNIGAAGDWKTFPRSEGNWDQQLALHAGRDGEVWVGGFTDPWVGRVDLKDGRWQDFTPPELHSVGIVGGSDDDLWVSGLGRLMHFDGSEWAGLDTTPRGSSWAVDKIFMGSGDQLWYGLAGGITWRVDVGDRLWKSYRGLHYQGETSDGGQWYLAKDGTVVEKADDGWRRHTTDDGLIDKVRVVICTSDGRVWAAGSHKGEAATAEFDGTRWLRQSHPGMGKTVDYRSFHEGRNGMLYIGATASVKNQAAVMMLDPRSDPPRWEEVSGSARLTNAIDIAEDTGQRLWTGGHALSVLAPDSTERIAFPELLRGAFIDAVEAGSDRGTVWVAARGRGIGAFDGKEWKQTTITDGLASNAISDMVADGEGGLWVAAAAGISRLRQDSIVTHGLGKSIPGVPIERGTIRVGPAGEVWINRASRKWLFDEPPPLTGEGVEPQPTTEPEFFCLGRSRDRSPPQVMIDPLLTDVSEAGNGRVSWSGVDAWHETPADELLYSWRHGDGPWSDFSTDTHATLLGLKPGELVFEVRCRDLDGNLGASPARTVLIVPYPAWRRPWFLLTVGLLLTVIVWFAWSMLRQRERHIVAEGQMKLDFYTRISHELSTPLTVVISTLENWQSDHSLSRLSVPLGRALRNAWRLQRIFDDILALRKAEEGRLTLDLAEKDADRVVARAVEALRPTAEQGGIDLHYETSDPGLRMMLDEEQLRRVVINLVSNAIKFTPAQGTVWVRLREDRAAHTAVIEVEDNGSGISTEDLPHIFEQYYRSGGSFAASIKGTGVGMAVVKEIIDHWDGEIDVQSPVDPAHGTMPGTRFRVKLPLSHD